MLNTTDNTHKHNRYYYISISIYKYARRRAQASLVTFDRWTLSSLGIAAMHIPWSLSSRHKFLSSGSTIGRS